jgi:uncharacterized protein YuzB (UPF0349 family)
MSIEMIDDDVDMDVVKYECWYWSVIDSMADLILNNGRDRVMADVADVVIKRLGDGCVSPLDDPLSVVERP